MTIVTNGRGRLWRKDPVKLVQAIQADNCIRVENPGERYRKARAEIIADATKRLANLDHYAFRIFELSRKEGTALAFGWQPTEELVELITAAKTHWRGIINGVQADLERQHADLLKQYGVEGWEVSVFERCPNLKAIAAFL